MTSEKFRDIRNRQGYSRTDLVKLLGASQASIWRWEEGVRKIPQSVAIVLTMLDAGAETKALVERYAKYCQLIDATWNHVEPSGTM